MWINEAPKVFIARRGVHELTTTILTGDEVRDLVEKMLKSPAAGSTSRPPSSKANSRMG